jgi:HD-GYP domain-containing protein (c-di-GMP phosphodiesterase class II)
LDKPDALSPLELESVREIPLYSATIAHQLGLSGKIQEAISQRHERPDGLGYPFGLHEGEISPLAKMIAVSDTFDSLTIDQPYRKGCTPREAIGIIRSKSQFQFDPEVVDALTLLTLPSH